MKRKRYTEEQIIRLLKEHESGTTIEELSRKHGIAKSSLQRWKARFSGMEVSDAKKLRELETENGKLKKLLAETLLEKTALEDVLSRKW